MILLALLAILLLCATVALVGWATALPRLDADRRIGLIADYGLRPIGTGAGDSDGGGKALENLAVRVGQLVGKRLGAHEPELRRELMAAGIYRVSPTAFLGYRALAAVALPVLFVAMAPDSWPAFARFAAIGYGGFCGWVLPLTIVRRRAKHRLDVIDLALPNMIELVVVTVEAGLGFASSLQAAANKLTGPLGDELRLLLQEQRMGLSSSEALRNLGQRADTPAMRSFVRAVVQGQELGVPIGQIMRALSIDMRKIRQAKAQERAQKAPVKMLFPMVFLLFPAMFIVMVGPAAMDLLDLMGNLGGK